jgi:branched-subunit amino acid ABC-type transport system permease component
VVTVYIGPSYTLGIVFAVLFAILLVSPRGILGRGMAV